MKPYSNTINPELFLLDGLFLPNAAAAPAKHLSSALSHTVAFLSHTQKFFSGPQTVPALNWFLAPFASKDSSTPSEIEHLMQGIIFQLAPLQNISIGLSLACPSSLSQQKAIHAGKRTHENYPSFEEEAKLIHRAAMNVLSQGQADGSPFNSPRIIVDAEKNPFAAEAAAKGSNIIFQRSQPLPPGTNKIVQVGLEAISKKAKTETKFFTLLDSALGDAKRALLEANSEIALSLNEHNLLPLLKARSSEGVPYYELKKRNLAFSISGMDKALIALTGEPIYFRYGLALAQKTLKHISERAEEFSKQHSFPFTLEQCDTMGLIPETELHHVDRARIEAQLQPHFNPTTVPSFSLPAPVSGETALELIENLSAAGLSAFCFH